MPQRDGAEADEQKAALEERLAGAEGMDEALEHLALAFFRGFAHVRPLWNGPGSLAGFDLLNGWNFARDPATKQWFWNPRAEYCDPSHPGPGLVPVPEGELVTVSRVREIDRPAMALCLRDAVGARDWGRFLERYGIPFVVFTAPPAAGDEAMPRFAEAGSGTLAGNAQMEVWQQIVKRDGVAIGAAIDRAVCRPLLRGIRDFAGRPPLVKFELGGDRQLDPGEIFDIAAKSRAAGYRVAKDELEKATGYTLEEEPQAAAAGGGYAQDGWNGIANPLQNARKGADGEMHPGDARGPSEAKSGETALLEAMASDLAPVRGRLEALLALPEAERPAAARALMEELPSLLPADPEMAAVLEEEMARAFAEEVGSGEEAVENAESARLTVEEARALYDSMMEDDSDAR